MESSYPYDQQLERATLGALLIAPDRLLELDLTEHDFYIHTHMFIFSAMRVLEEQRHNIDLVTLTEQLSQNGKLQDIGGSAYLTGLLTDAPSSNNLPDYCTMLRKYSIRRDMLRLASDLAAEAMRDNNDPSGAIENAIDRLSGIGTSKTGTVSFSVYLGQVFDKVQYAMEHPCDIFGIPTGLIDYDALTGGVQPADLIYIAGEPGIGKSRVMMRMAIGMALSGRPGVIYSPEMTGEASALRAASAYAKVPTRSLETGRITPDEWSEFCRGVDKLSTAPIFFNPDPINLQFLRSDLYRLKYKEKIEWFMLDYLQLVQGFENLDETTRGKRLSRNIKEITKRLAIPGIVANSVTKDGIDTENPSMKNMSGPSSALHDADIVFFVTKSKFALNVLQLQFVKTRSFAGAGATIEVIQNSSYPSIESAITYKKVNLDKVAV